ncbi:outer membrane efflux protein [Candidatus Koribacter versatilis Ellin345]|uniref:Outer membrane efflux protein n=1 Tax=Koribacter versatilis (strain Ellin345) TaxID=204669 RepID=Q1IRQ3_KORVE|nr:TolC family protein [Candidatus Koribacter versatilis]ABF40447.1 outer membrane efflux protein [Candidatus Koribacter versatilis Ellin345]
MSVSRTVVITARTVIFSMMLGMVAPAFAQNQAPAPTPNLPDAPKAASASAPVNGGVMSVDYSKPKTYWFNPVGTYSERKVPAPNFANTARVDSVMRDGKIYLSMSDALALALENNLDIAIARYNLPIADTDILSTKAGSAARGVNAGVVQNTPGGGVGGIGASSTGGGAGGTTAGAGGVGTGIGGIVASTTGAGSTVGNYDPFITGNVQGEHTRAVVTTSYIPVPFIVQNNTTYNFNYAQSWYTGTSANIGWQNTRQAGGLNVLDPYLNSTFRFTLTQHLLQGFGLGPNMRFIRIAQNDKKITDSAFRQQVRETVSQIQNIYWDLVAAYEDVKVKQRALEFAQRTFSDNQKQVQIGTLAPIEVVHAQSTVSTAQQDLIVSQTSLQLQQLLMKNAITRNMGDPILAAAEVIPTDTMQVDANEVDASVDELIKTAQEHSPEIEQAQIDLKNREITMKSTKNALLPSLDAYGFYGAAGNAGEPIPGAGSTINPSGYGDALGHLVDSSSPDKGLGVTLTIPIRNRAAQATQVRSQLEFRQAQMRLQQLFNQVNIQVRNAAFAVQQDRARVKAAQASREYALQSLEAEQKKYALGASTSTLVLQNQSGFENAENLLVSALTAYEKHKVELDRVTSQTLDKNRIELADSTKGVVNTAPQVPGVIKITSDVNNPANEPQHPAPPQQPQPETPQQPQK